MAQARRPLFNVPAVPWWVLLVVGVAWLLFGMVVLQFDLTSARAIALAAGLLLVVASLSQFVDALAARPYRWVHLVLSVVFFVLGIMCLIWPAPTFLVLTRLVAWVLLFKGIAYVVIALVSRGEHPLWWLFLALGLLLIVLAFWAAGVPSRSATLLALWIGLVALAKGVTDIALAFGIRNWERAPTTGQPGS